MWQGIFKRIQTLSMVQIAALIAFVPVGVVVWVFQNTFIVPLLLVPIVLGGFYYRGKLSDNWRMIYVVALVAVNIVLAGTMFRTIRANNNYPPEFDFKSFWLNGRVSSQGMNFYDPENYRREAIPLNPTSAMTDELINSAFWYPPPSILLFVPLGWFSDVNTAMLAWNIILCIFLGICCWLTWKLFFHDAGMVGLLAATAIVFLNPAVWATFFYGQSSILLLFLWLIIWRDRDLPRVGVWLGLSILVKPFMAILLLYFVLQKQWRSVIVVGVTLLGACLVVLALFGAQPFLSYQPTARLPTIMYVEWVNQGLLAYILRFTQYDYGHSSPIMHPAFLIGAGLLTLFTCWLVYKLPKRENHWGLLLALMLTLLVYPATLMHYSILLVIPLIVIWKYGADFAGGIKGNLIFVTALFTIITFD